MHDSRPTPPLEPDTLIAAYARGIFPMDFSEGEVHWFSPDPRGVLPLDERFHVPKNLAKLIRQRKFEIAVDRDFAGTLRGCAERDETWISDCIADAYLQLYDVGVAHSVEAWQGGQLVGGLYGVSLGGAFFGESMFTRARDASKVCLVHLVDRLRAGGFSLLDTQWTTDHLKRFGAMELPRPTYLAQLRRALQVKANFFAWDEVGDR